MAEKVFFMGGLPRSGSTLLCNVLAQNPRFHVTSTSGFVGVLNSVRASFWSNQAFKAMKPEEVDTMVADTMRGALRGYAAGFKPPVFVEKSRGVESYCEMIELILGERPKIICPVRDLRDVLASFEKLWRDTSTTRMHPDEQAFPFSVKTADARASLLCRQEGGLLGVSVNGIKDAVQRGYKKSLHFVEYDEFCRRPKEILSGIYEFLGEEKFEHDFDNVKQVVSENDLIHVYKNLHNIRSKIVPQPKNAYMAILPKPMWAAYEEESKFWRKLQDPDEQ